ncbi:hypothetical protein M8U36_24425, partial [Enterobacter hormaechei]|nr:hypothetical protein [Enterobacter hormaechei]
MGSCAAPSAKGDDKFITTDYLQQCRTSYVPINVSFSPKVGPGLPGINRDTRIYLFCEVIFRHRYLFGAKCVG